MNRSGLFLLLGMLSAWVWIIPIFVFPGQIDFLDNENQTMRILRQCSVLFILPFTILSLFRMIQRELVLRLVCVVFFILPLPSILLTTDLNFFFFVYGSFFIGGLSILILTSMRGDDFRSWLIGLSFIACLYLFAAMTSVGFGYTNVYGRERASFGFIHPTQTSAVILMAGLMSILLFNNVKYRLLKVLAFLFFLWLLYEASSKNTLLIYLVVTLLSLFYKKIPTVIRLGMGYLVLNLPFIVFFYAIFGDVESELWQLLNWYSSERFSVYKELISHFNPSDPYCLFLGPCLSDIQSGEFHGFASSESVYFSIFANFGLVTLTGFILLLLLLVIRLSKKSNYIGYSGVIGLIIFYAIDSQGVTIGNLIILILFAGVLRESLRCSSAKKVSSTTEIINA